MENNLYANATSLVASGRGPRSAAQLIRYSERAVTIENCRAGLTAVAIQNTAGLAGLAEKASQEAPSGREYYHEQVRQYAGRAIEHIGRF